MSAQPAATLAHRRARRWFWRLLIAATAVSVLGNIVHALLPHLPSVAVQIGAAAIPPTGLLCAVHSLAHLVRGGASGRVYRWSVAAVACVLAAAFTLSFIALRDLAVRIGYTPHIAWLFPIVIDFLMGIATIALVALGDTPRTDAGADDPAHSAPQASTNGYHAATNGHAVQTADTRLANELISSGTTTQPVDTVLAVLASHRDGASINGTAKSAGINYRTAARIVQAAHEKRGGVASGKKATRLRELERCGVSIFEDRAPP